MRIGFTLPQLGALARQAPQITRFAAAAEELGADSLWVADRLLSPVDPKVGYAGSDTFPPEFRAILDPFAVLTAAATATSRVALGTNVLNAPWYPPALLARTLTTIDRISGGRLIPGFGSGWSPEEFEAVDVPMTERGRRLDECLDALEQLWTANPSEYHGELWQVPATHADLKPVQRPRIYLGGFAPAALRRVATKADGWLPVVMQPSEFDAEAAIAGPMRRIRQIAEEHGRDPGSLDMILRVYPFPAASLDDVVDTIKRAREETEVRHVLVDLMYHADNVDTLLEKVETVLTGVRG
jgi:probable F420-dependent oxidoreductase